MTDRRMQARVLLGEAHALGLSLADLIAAAGATAADGAAACGPTVSGYLATIAPTFTAGTAATYRPYWRLAAARLGDRRLTEIGVADLHAVAEDAVARARRRRPDSDGRASRVRRGAAGPVQSGGGRRADGYQPGRRPDQAPPHPQSPPCPG